MPNEIIKERVNVLEPNYLSFVLSDSPSQIAKNLAKVHHFDEDTYAVFENGFAMFLLFFIDRAGLVKYLISDCRLKSQDAELLAVALLLALPPDIREQQEVTSQVLFNPNDEIDKDYISKEIAEAEAALKAIEPKVPTPPYLQTPSDKTYTSTQSAILHDKIPSESGPNSPRWSNQ